MGPHIPFAPALLTLSLQITLHIYFISSCLFNLLYQTCVMVNKAVNKKKNKEKKEWFITGESFLPSMYNIP